VRVETLEIVEVEVPLRSPFSSSTSCSDRIVHSLVRLSAEGISGWGEAPVGLTPAYLAETPETVWHAVGDHLAPLVLSAEFAHPSELSEALAKIKGNQCARSAVEMAMWDLWCRVQGVSLASALGGTSSRVPAGATVGAIGEAGQPGDSKAVESKVVEAVERCVEAGYRRVKVKIAPGWDYRLLEAVRARHDSLVLVADANGSYSLSRPDHLDALRSLDSLGLAGIEQPLGEEELVGHARLQEMLATPVVLDESIVSVGVLEAALALGCCRGVSVKAARLGGLCFALKAVSRCREAGVAMWCGGMLELGIGRAANLALGSLADFSLPGDMAGSDLYFSTDVVVPPARVEEGTLEVPGGPGLGVEVDEAALVASARRSVRFASR
jgi:O-succinylbenzoate synthase